MIARAWRNESAFIALVGGAAALTAVVYAASAYALSPFALPALAIGGAVAAAALARPAAGVAVALAVAPLESASLPLPTGSLSPSEGLLAMVGVGYLVRLLYTPETVVKPSLRDLPFLALLAVALLGITFASDPSPIFRVCLLWFLFYGVHLQAQSFSVAEMKTVIGALAIGAGLLGAVGTVRYLQSGNAVVFDAGAVTGARAAGTFADPNYYGSLMQLALIPGIALLLTRARNWTLGVPLVLAFSGLVFSLSRGAALGFAMALLILLSWNRARWLAFVLISVVVITTMLNVNPLIGSQQLTTVEQRLSSVTRAHESSTNNRPRIWAAAIDETEKHPFFGIGLNQFSEVAARHGVTERGSPLENAHNVFLSLSVETGLIGLSLFVLFLAAVGLRAARAAAFLPDAALRGLALGLLATLAGFLVQGLTANQLRDNLITGTFLVLSGMLVALGRVGGPVAEEVPAAD
ncbi:MAG: hypothetical protein QOJ29_3391 [Thermoleophilaceae bacterium]|jgi:O-antigen ligase|nr:hypothetical protein [Thermoleophilaceae bacterium]